MNYHACSGKQRNIQKTTENIQKTKTALISKYTAID